jgi:hypothetical protein
MVSVAMNIIIMCCAVVHWDSIVVNKKDLLFLCEWPKLTPRISQTLEDIDTKHGWVDSVGKDTTLLKLVAIGPVDTNGRNIRSHFFLFFYFISRHNIRPNGSEDFPRITSNHASREP